MYNPSRGGVRGGADQFTWESVKSDKHRENYLGHSLMAPVGRWQKGKDLSWYAKERKDTNAPDKSDKSELASIKRAEEEAMLIALGHNVVRKTEALSKEDIREALKRNTGERDDHNIERVDGVGASSQRVALLSGLGKNSRTKSEGVAFEGRRDRSTDSTNKSERKDEAFDEKKSKAKKKLKKHKKEKKHKKLHKDSHGSDLSDSTHKHKKSESDSDSRKSSKVRSHKKSKHRQKDYSSDNSEEKYHSNSYQEDRKRHKKQKNSVKRRRHDTSESD